MTLTGTAQTTPMPPAPRTDGEAFEQAVRRMREIRQALERLIEYGGDAGIRLADIPDAHDLVGAAYRERRDFPQRGNGVADDLLVALAEDMERRLLAAVRARVAHTPDYEEDDPCTPS